jgi:hypothetical protein
LIFREYRLDKELLLKSFIDSEMSKMALPLEFSSFRIHGKKLLTTVNLKAFNGTVDSGKMILH